MTRPSKREVERAVDRLDVDDGDDTTRALFSFADADLGELYGGSEALFHLRREVTDNWERPEEREEIDT